LIENLEIENLDNEISVCIVSLWEIAIMVHWGKLTLVQSFGRERVPSNQQ